MVMWKLKSAATALVALGVLIGCGPMPETTPTSTTTSATMAPGGGAATVAPGEATAIASSSAATAVSGTPETGSLTFGDLADRVGAAWPGVRSYRVTFTGSALSGPTGAGTPVARPAATPGATPMARPRNTYTTVRDVQLPDRQRQTVTGLGADDHEAISIGNTLFVRGPMVERIAPGAPTSTWVELDPSQLPEGAMLVQLLGGLPALPGPPLATLPERLRAQDVRELDPVEFDGRDCQVFAAADTVPATGMRVDYTIAIDENDIPCFVETGAGGVAQGRDEYSDINAEMDIAPPAAATPVSIPPALATPIAHD
jgi:hypothetical protein